jgi:hypothetical protein
MSRWRKLEASPVGQALLMVLWVITLPLQFIALVVVAIYCLITGKDWNQ